MVEDAVANIDALVVVLGLLAAVNVVYWRLPDEYRNHVLTAVGAVGLASVSLPAFVAMAAVVGVVHVGLRADEGRLALRATAVVVIGFVVYKSFADRGPFDRGVALLGLAYAVPRAVHVLVDARYRNLRRPSFSMLNAYFWFFPTIVVGPIHRFDEFARGVRRRRFDALQVGRGLERILLGLLSVKVLADWLVASRLQIVIDGLDESRDGLRAVLESVSYGLNLYFAFAGWSAVAIGVAATFGFVVAENFDRPFAQPNITRFWRCWHMTLTRWTREYVFTPVLASTRRPQLAVVATMLAIAFWHVLSFQYLAWGIWHAAGLVVHRFSERLAASRPSGSLLPAWVPPRVVHAAAVAVTVVFVMLGFTITRTADLGAAMREFEAMVTGGYR